MELIRRVLRGWLGWDSRCYRLGARLLGLIGLISRESPATARELYRLERAEPGGAPGILRFSRLEHPFSIRPGSKDVSVAINNFVREEYGAEAPDGSPRLLIDAGAYIGDTSAYFLSRFPTIRTIALEPMADSFKMARRNLEPYGDRVDLRACALSVDGKPVCMSGTETGACIDEDGSIEVPSVSIPQLLDNLPEGHIDILKMDIEGAESKIFSGSLDWLEHVGMIIVETHGPDATNIVLNSLKSKHWSANMIRNLYFCKPDFH